MLDSNYIVGLTDGEGSFTFRLNVNPSRRNRMEPRFYIKLQERDKKLLDEIQKFFGCGKVYIQRDVRPRHSNCYRFEVGNRNELLEKIIPFFRKNPLKAPSRKKDFELFSRAMEIFRDGKHFSENGIRILQKIKAEMH